MKSKALTQWALFVVLLTYGSGVAQASEGGAQASATVEIVCPPSSTVFQCDNDGNGTNEACFGWDANSDGVLDACFDCTKSGTGPKDGHKTPLTAATVSTCANRISNGTTITTNGCSAPWWAIAFGQVFLGLNGQSPDNPCGDSNTGFRDACNVHDGQYAACAFSKTAADSAFRANLESICATAQMDCSATGKTCYSLAKAYADAVSTADEAQNAFDSAKIAHCVCCN